MNKLFFLFCLISISVFLVCEVGWAANPKPAADDYVLPMPDGEEMVFRPVFLGIGAKPFALKEFTAGESVNKFKEYPTPVTVGGSFKKSNANNVSDWLYYLGKYEVTEAQYYAIMEPGSHKGDQHPITRISWFDALEFINKYNIWLYEHAVDKLPENSGTPGFIRLPTEAEWEFAVRGGSVVDGPTFDKKTPYDGRLSKYEWFSGPKSSHGKVKKIGLLKPNPLGLHDMLGNVEEMTSSQFMLEYYQGRVGGFVVKGGYCNTLERDLRSSLRSETPFYQKKKGKMVPSSKPVLGLRLIIASPVFTSRSRQTFKKLEQEWQEYAKSRKPPLLAGQGNTSQQSLEQLKKQIAALQEALKEAKEDKTSMKGMWGKLVATVNNLRSGQAHKENMAAFSWIKVATDAACMIVIRDISELSEKEAAHKRAIDLAEKTGNSRMLELAKKIEKQLADMKANIQNISGTILLAYQQLKELDSQSSVQKGLEQYKTFLQTNQTGNGNIDAQIRMSDLLMQYYQEFLKNGKLDSSRLIADLEAFQI